MLKTFLDQTAQQHGTQGAHSHHPVAFECEALAWLFDEVVDITLGSQENAQNASLKARQVMAFSTLQICGLELTRF